MPMMNKPRVVEKLHAFMKAVRANDNKVGAIPRSIIINYNNTCNFKCEFCATSEDGNAHVREYLDLDTIRSLADQADELGVWEITLQGGEVLVNLDRLYAVIEAINPDRFQIYLISNGYLMTPEVARELAQRGVDSVGVSLSSMDADKHNKERGGIKDAHKRALEALDNIRTAGMAPCLNMIFGHHNLKDPDLYNVLDYAKERGYSTWCMLAMPFGAWKDNIMDAEDVKIFSGIRKKYDTCFCTWDMYDRKKERISGCWTVNRLYITPLGDVLACAYIDIKIGNIKEQPLKEIYDYGFSIKYFGGYSPICVSAQNRAFRNKFLDKPADIFSPLDAHEIFGEEDYIK